jgi:glycine/D-amino acid oxidase-like deaminating enzyme
VRTISPHVEADRLTGALFYPEDGIVAPRDLMSALKAACLARGITLWERSPVDEIEVHEDSVSLMGRRFAAAIVASGAWSSSISVKGVPPLPHCEPVKGHLLGFDLQLGACPTIVRHQHIYVFQRGTGFAVAGSSTEHVGFERAINSAVSEQLFRQVTRVLPVLEKVQAVDVWTGFRPSSDKLHIEAWHRNNLFLAYGHYRNGILLAPATADRLVETILLSTPIPGSIRSGAPH